MTINPLLPVSVSISPSANDICEGASVTFTPEMVNGGTPAYQWFKNSELVGTGGTYSCIPSNGDQVYVIMTSSLTCNSGSPATSNTVTMIVNPLLPVSVSILPSANNICEGASVTFTPDPVNGGTPSYQWFKNSEPVGTSGTYSCIPESNDQLHVVMTSDLTCNTGSPATSNTVTMMVNPLLPVSVTIEASENPVDKGTPVTYTASAVNGGASPVYQWLVNGSDAGTNNDLFTYVPFDGDVVSCMLTSAETCTSSNPAYSSAIIMVVNAVPATLDLQNLTVSGAECYDALQTISVAGNGTFFSVPAGDSATMIAGFNILYYPGTVVSPGGYLYGYIAPEGPWCVAPPVPAVLTGTTELILQQDPQHYRVYPNPTTGSFLLELNAPDTSEQYLVEIYDMQGKKILSDEWAGKQKREFSLSGQPAGIYLIRVISERISGTTRIIKQK
jgi:hypothetical protein